MSEGSGEDYKQVALAFTKALARRDYESAYALTAKAYRATTGLHDLQAAFEAVVPTDWETVDPVEIGLTMEDWPGKESSDVGWVYVTVGGDVYSEAVTIVVALAEGGLKIRTVEFGRP